MPRLLSERSRSYTPQGGTELSPVSSVNRLVRTRMLCGVGARVKNPRLPDYDFLFLMIMTCFN